MGLKYKQLGVGIVTVVIVQSFYKVIQVYTVGSHDLMTALDRVIPFWPDWIWIYISIFFAFIYASATLESRKFQATLRRVILAHLITYPFFILYPCSFPRPNVVDDGTLYGWGYALLHSLDGPHNTFPSMHVSMTWIVCHELGEKKINKILFAIYATIVSLSILFTKQHFVADMIGGFVVYLITIYFIKTQKPR